MAALTVLSKFYNDKLEMSLAEFYEHPTASSQAALLMSRQAKPAPAPAAEPAEKLPLITGATGFFGVHLLKELIDNGRQTVLCLMRDGSQERLEGTLDNYFGASVRRQLMEHIRVVKGDIAQQQLGMPSQDYQALSAQVGEVYHAAADVRHYAADAEPYMQTNVGGTEQMIALARAAGAKLYHMSTCSVAGELKKDGTPGGLFTENDLDVGQIWERNIYVRSKFLAEQAVFAAMQTGLEAKIFRLGRLVGRESDGKFQSNPQSNAFYLTMKGFSQIGAIPADAARQPIDLMPIDLAAREVLLLTGSEGTVFHIMNAVPPTLGQVMTAVNPQIRIVDSREYRHILADSWDQLDDVLWAVVADCVRSNATEGKIQVTNTLTTDALQKVGFLQESVCVEMVLREFWKGA